MISGSRRSLFVSKVEFSPEPSRVLSVTFSLQHARGDSLVDTVRSAS